MNPQSLNLFKSYALRNNYHNHYSYRFLSSKDFYSTISKLKDYDLYFSKNAEDYELLKDRKLKELEEVDIT